MIALRSRTGTTIDLDITEEVAAQLRPAIAPGWAFGRMVSAPQFQPLDAPAVKPPRARKPKAAPVAEHLAAVTAFFAPGLEATKAKCREATGLAIDTVDACVAWLVAAGKLAKVSAKVYRAKVPA